MIHGLAKKIEAVLCRYLGLENDVVKAENVSFVSNKLFINSHFPYKRHIVKASWDDFSNFSINVVKNIEKDKLGLAVGKALAKNLIINFEDTEFQRKNS